MCRDGFVRCRGVSGDGMSNVGIGLGGLGGGILGGKEWIQGERVMGA